LSGNIDPLDTLQGSAIVPEPSSVVLVELGVSTLGVGAPFAAIDRGA
jgi:hypothetical protein